MTIKTSKNQIKIIIVLIILMMAAVMVFNNISGKEKQSSLSREQVLQEAIAHFHSMVDTREWNARYGGVYVKPTEGHEPNPYLEDNTLLSYDGEQLIKINPAWMTRQISEFSNKKRHYYFRITSLKPLNPHNLAGIGTGC